MDRRKFILGTGAMLLGCSRPSGAALIPVQVFPQLQLSAIPPDFLGLGFETSSVAVPGLFTPQNAVLIQLLRTLTQNGVLRIGADASDSATYSPNATPVAAPNGTVLNDAVLNSLGAFLQATGWKALWGLNLATGTIALAQQEAAAVNAALGNSLMAFEIGNEPDAYAGNVRPAGWAFPDYFAEFQQMLSAVRTQVPGASVMGPDVFGATDWVASFAQQEPDAKLLTHHFYAGIAIDPNATIASLLQSNVALESLLARIAPVSVASGIPFRIDEMNSLVLGGKPGVSDTFASALWGLDVMFALAQAGGAGINLESGLNQFNTISSYSPIVQDARGNWVPRPLYYGMLAFAVAAQGTLVECTLGASPVNLKAYSALHGDGTLWVVLINKDLAQAATLSLRAPAGFGNGSVLRLVAPAIDSTTGVTLGAAAVSESGTWSAVTSERVENGGALELPAGCAALVQFRS